MGLELLLELDDDQLFWRETVQSALSKQCPASLVRRIAEGTAEADGLWAWYVENGWTDLGGPESFVELTLLLEELGRATDPTPFLASTTQFAPLVGERFDPTIAGSVVYAGVDVRRSRDGWILDGTAQFVLDGDRAEQFAVVTAAGIFITNASDVKVRRVATFDPLLHFAEVSFADAWVSKDNHVAGDAEGAWHIALTGAAITTVGACQRILDLTLEHMKERHQFGVPIGSFQALQHKAADMHVMIERARALSYFSALTVSVDDPRRRLASVMAKIAAGEAQALVVQYGMQSFGGMGLTWENDLQFAVKRARACELMLGDAAQHRTLLTKEYRATDF